MMRKEFTLAAAATLLATSACGGGEAPVNNQVEAQEALNVASTALEDAGAEVANAAEAVETAPSTDEGAKPVKPVVTSPPPPPPAPKAKAVPVPKAVSKAPAPPKADPHAGHDMSNMSGHNMSH